VGLGHGRSHSQHSLHDKQTTIITTNYPDLGAGGGVQTEAERAAASKPWATASATRMRSRLAEMCVRVEMTGEDFRQTVKRARFGYGTAQKQDGGLCLRGVSIQ